jgi:hypothetical protein
MKVLMTMMVGAVLSIAFPYPADAAIYWSSGATISRANLDGTNREDDFILAGNSICSIAIDASHLYWANSAENSIGRANLDGTNLERNFISLAGDAPCRVTIGTDYIYWSNLGGNSLGRALLDGSQVEPDFIVTEQHPCGVAVTPTAIYWSSDDEGKIWKTDLDGIHAQDVVVEGLAAPCGLVADQSHLFWGDDEVDAIGRARLDGSELSTNFISADGPSAIAVDGNHLYWVNAGSANQSIARSDLDGSNVDQSFLENLKYAWALAIDASTVVPKVTMPRPVATFRIGRPRRNKKSGSISFPVFLPRNGYLDAGVNGAKVTILPEHVTSRGFVGAGRKWLLIEPTKKGGGGSRCVRRALRRGDAVKLVLQVRFGDVDLSWASQSRRFRLFRQSKHTAPHARSRPQRSVSCQARPPG